MALSPSRRTIRRRGALRSSSRKVCLLRLLHHPFTSTLHPASGSPKPTRLQSSGLYRRGFHLFKTTHPMQIRQGRYPPAMPNLHLLSLTTCAFLSHRSALSCSMSTWHENEGPDSLCQPCRVALSCTPRPAVTDRLLRASEDSKDVNPTRPHAYRYSVMDHSAALSIPVKGHALGFCRGSGTSCAAMSSPSSSTTAAARLLRVCTGRQVPKGERARPELSPGTWPWLGSRECNLSAVSLSSTMGPLLCICVRACRDTL